MKFLLTFLIAALPFNSFTAKKVITGQASYYHSKFNGRKTATGERFSNDSLTAASNRFPLHTVVLVTNISNGKQVTVRINDRMGNKYRIIDLSQTAAKNIGFYGMGLAKVSVKNI